MTTITTVLLCIIGMLFGWTLALREEAKQWKVYANKLQKDYIKQLQGRRNSQRGGRLMFLTLPVKSIAIVS